MNEKLPPRYYYDGMDLANFQTIKMVARHLSFRETKVKAYRDAIINLADQAEKEIYKTINTKIKGEIEYDYEDY